MSALEERLQRLEDLEAIRQLFVDYGHYLDKCDFESYAKLYAEEGEALLGPVGRAKGPAAIRAMMEKTMPNGPGSSYHIIANPVINLDGDRATTDVSWAVVNQGPNGEAVLSMFGRHKDIVVKEGGAWKFLRRAGYVDVPKVYRASS